MVIAHKTPVRVWAVQDINVAFPRDRFVELEAEGTIGQLAPRSVSMVGSITKYTELIQKTVRPFWIDNRLDRPQTRRYSIR